MSEPIRILIVEDLPVDADLAMREIRKSLMDCVFQRVETESTFLEALDKFNPDLILSDYHLPHFTGMQALKLAIERVPLTPLIITTGSKSEDIAVDCMKAGATDYIIKENIKRLGTAVLHALEEKQVRIERKQAERTVQMRTEDLALVNALNEAANRGENIDGIVKLFSRNIESMIPSCHSAAIYLLDVNEKRLELRGMSLSASLIKKIENLIGQPIPKIEIPVRKDSYFQKIMDTGQGTITTDPKIIQQEIAEFAETTFIPPLIRNGFKKFVPQIYQLLNINSVLTIPLISSGSTVGLLDVASDSVLTADDLTRIRNISGQVTAVILRRQADEKIHRQLGYLTGMRDIDRMIESTFDLQISMMELTARARSLLAVDAVAVFLLDATGTTLKYTAGLGFQTDVIKTADVKLGHGYAGKVALERRLIKIPNLAEEKDNPFFEIFQKNEKFASYYGTPLIVKGKVIGVLEVFHRNLVKRDQEWLDFFDILAGEAAVAIDNVQLFEGLQKSNFELILAYDATITGWSRAMDLRDKETEGHTKRVTELTLKLAEKMGISQEKLTHIRRGALLHDIGKLGVPDHILLKPSELTEEEWDAIYKHPTFAFDMLLPITYLRPALDIPYCHHEKWDGTGYPRGLKGEQIPLPARLFAIVDVYDALTSDRPYRPRWSTEKANQYIQEQSGRHFDPKVVEAFLSLIDKE
jgi:putative nucleotidyltransferase with HDIG domain